MREQLYGLYWRLSTRITPGLVNAQHRYLDALEEHVRPGIRWLDLGCGHRVVTPWLPDADRRQHALIERAGLSVGVDLDLPSLVRNRVHRGLLMGDLAALPFPDNSFDLVTANMVFEHLADPGAVIRQVARVLRPGGALLFHTPNYASPFTFVTAAAPQRAKDTMIRLLENRPPDDVFPTFYRINTEASILRHADRCGFEPHRIGLVESSPQLVMLGPAVIGELLLIRLIRCHRFRRLRSNIICVLRRPANKGPYRASSP